MNTNSRDYYFYHQHTTWTAADIPANTSEPLGLAYMKQPYTLLAATAERWDQIPVLEFPWQGGSEPRHIVSEHPRQVISNPGPALLLPPHHNPTRSCVNNQHSTKQSGPHWPQPKHSLDTSQSKHQTAVELGTTISSAYFATLWGTLQCLSVLTFCVIVTKKLQFLPSIELDDINCIPGIQNSSITSNVIYMSHPWRHHRYSADNHQLLSTSRCT